MSSFRIIVLLSSAVLAYGSLADVHVPDGLPFYDTNAPMSGGSEVPCMHDLDPVYVFNGRSVIPDYDGPLRIESYGGGAFYVAVTNFNGMPNSFEFSRDGTSWSSFRDPVLVREGDRSVYIRADKHGNAFMYGGWNGNVGRYIFTKFYISNLSNAYSYVVMTGSVGSLFSQDFRALRGKSVEIQTSPGDSGPRLISEGYYPLFILGNRIISSVHVYVPFSRIMYDVPIASHYGMSNEHLIGGGTHGREPIVCTVRTEFDSGMFESPILFGPIITGTGDAYLVREYRPWFDIERYRRACGVYGSRFEFTRRY